MRESAEADAAPAWTHKLEMIKSFAGHSAGCVGEHDLQPSADPTCLTSTSPSGRARTAHGERMESQETQMRGLGGVCWLREVDAEDRRGAPRQGGLLHQLRTDR